MMVRFFVNSFPWSWGLELRSYKIEHQYLSEVCIVISEDEAELARKSPGWGLWRVQGEKMRRYLPESKYDTRHPLHGYDHFGTLLEHREGRYIFTEYYIKRGQTPVEIDLPSERALKKMGLSSTK